MFVYCKAGFVWLCVASGVNSSDVYHGVSGLHANLLIA